LAVGFGLLLWFFLDVAVGEVRRKYERAAYECPVNFQTGGFLTDAAPYMMRLETSCRYPALLLTLIALALAGGCTSSDEPTARADLERAFQEEFGFRPPAAVSIVRSRTVRIGDTWGRWLCFTYEPSTLQRITNAGFVVPEPRELAAPETQLWSQDLFSHNPNEPTWWRTPAADRSDPVRYKEGQMSNYHRSFTYLWLSNSNKTVYVRTVAWD
jgi:hypothetical protein